MIDLDLLEARAKAATPGPWETEYRQRYVFAENGVNVCEIRGYGELIYIVPESDVIEQMRSNAAFIAAANPAVVLELIAELRAKNKLDEVNEWTEELEKTALRNELKRVRAERDWLAEHIPNTVCPEGKSECDDRTPTAGGTVGYACLLCWLKAASEAVEGKK